MGTDTKHGIRFVTKVASFPVGCMHHSGEKKNEEAKNDDTDDEDAAVVTWHHLAGVVNFPTVILLQQPDLGLVLVPKYQGMTGFACLALYLITTGMDLVIFYFMLLRDDGWWFIGAITLRETILVIE